MYDTTIAAKLLKQLESFLGRISPHFHKPVARFIGDMMYGIMAEKDVKLSSIVRALKEGITPKKAEDRLSRMLSSNGLERDLHDVIAAEGARKVHRDTLIILDPSDVQKPYAKKMEHLAKVWDGSKGVVGDNLGYWGCMAVACDSGGRRPTPLHFRLWSADSPGFVSENDEVESIVKTMSKHTKRRGIYVYDRGGCGREDGEWRVILRKNLSNVGSSIFRSNLVQTGLNLIALALMFGLYAILRRRERDMEQEKATAKSYFFSTVSHDIRTPLNAIIGYSTMLESGFKTEAERKEAIDSIIMSGKTLLGLVNDVLDLSKLEGGKMEILLEPTDCSRLVHAVLEAFHASSGRSGLELRCSAGEMPLLMLDPQRLRQIMFNLVGNAVKFTEKGHVEIRAKFERRTNADKGVLRLEVEDTGCGISEKDLERIGSAYVQVGSKVSRNGGTGLGLAICKQLAAAMGGRLEVESTLGVGSTFSVIIPNVKVAESAVAAQGRVNPPAAAQQRVPLVKMPHRILLVDDSRMNLMVLKALLKNMGDFEVATAPDGSEALKLLTSPDAPQFDLVLTDMWMPNLDGEGLMRAIRSNPALAALPVLAVTADVEVRDKSSEKGFDGILLKPITPATLEKALLGIEESRQGRT